MSDDTLIVTEVVNSVTVTPVNNIVTVSEVGTQGPAGANGTNGTNGATDKNFLIAAKKPADIIWISLLMVDYTKQ